MGVLSFELSGLGENAAGPLDLAAVQQLALDAGFAKPDVGDDKPLSVRADLATFFRSLGVNSLSAFRTKFWTTRMDAPIFADAPPPPSLKKASSALRGGKSSLAPLPSAAALAAFPTIDEALYSSLSSGLEALKWRTIPRPGGATMKPEAYYSLAGARAQADKGDVSGEKPMWAPQGGLDFDGRALYDAHERLGGMDATAAKRVFLATHAAALKDPENWRRY